MRAQTPPQLVEILFGAYRRRILAQSSFDAVMKPMQPQQDGAHSSNLLGATTGQTQYDFTQGHIEQQAHTGRE